MKYEDFRAGSLIDLSDEADGWDVETVSPGSNKKMPSVCRIDDRHRWSEIVANRTKGHGCPYCSNHKVLKGFNDLTTTHPELAAEAYGWDPTTVIAGTPKKLSWQCSVDPRHTWEASCASRSKSGTGCPICVNRKVLVGFNDLATTHPEIAVEADGWDPTTVVAGSARRVPWRCSLDSAHTWNSRISHRAGAPKTGCPVCARKQLLPGDNDLATTHPLLAQEAFGWDPSLFLAGSQTKKQWKCATHANHIWVSTIANRAVKGRGCPYCSNKLVAIGFNDLATTHPEVAAEADGWDPTTVVAGSNKRLNWKCTEYGHRWTVTPNSRTSRGGTNCPVCDGKALLKGFNDLKSTYEGIAAEALGWDPASVHYGSESKRLWQCPNEASHQFLMLVSNRTRLGQSCPDCATSGYRRGSPGWIYLIRHELWGLMQIGISNEPEVRLKVHRRVGWEVLEVKGPYQGDVAARWEQEILNALTVTGVKRGSLATPERFTGLTESWSEHSYRPTNLNELMDLVRDVEDRSSRKDQ